VVRDALKANQQDQTRINVDNATGCKQLNGNGDDGSACLLRYKTTKHAPVFRLVEDVQFGQGSAKAIASDCHVIWNQHGHLW
jgi:hypothetical protein